MNARVEDPTLWDKAEQAQALMRERTRLAGQVDTIRALERELDLYYLKARVRKINHVEAKNGLITWELLTDMGPKTVHIRDRQHIRPLADGRTILTDIHDAKYEVPPMDQLDEKSRDWLSIEL